MVVKTKNNKKPTCGNIMPISTIDGCSSEQWADVLSIIKDVRNINDFIPNLVIDADDIGVIQIRIIENIHSSSIIVCDVSYEIANVMFELKMRLAFDKPTNIIKDELTGYSSDTSLIEHLEYPRDLRFTSNILFKEKLGKNLKATYEKSTKVPNYFTFLKNIGKYKIAHFEDEDREVTLDTRLVNAIEELRKDVRTINNNFINEKDDINFRWVKNRKSRIRILSDKEKIIFKNYVHDFLKTKNVKAKPKDMNIMLPDIVDEFKKHNELNRIADNRNTSEQ